MNRIAEYNNALQRVMILVIQVRRRYKMHIIYVFVPKISHLNKVGGDFNGEIPSMNEKGKYYNKLLMGYSNAKIGRKAIVLRRKSAIWNAKRNMKLLLSFKM